MKNVYAVIIATLFISVCTLAQNSESVQSDQVDFHRMILSKLYGKADLPVPDPGIRDSVRMSERIRKEIEKRRYGPLQRRQVEIREAQRGLDKPDAPSLSEFEEAWVAIYGSDLLPEYGYPSAATTDEFGNVYVTGTVGYTVIITIKFDADGNLIWESEYDGAGDWKYTADIAISKSGYIYVTGAEYIPGLSDDFLTLKYDTDGTILWSVRYDGPENYWDEASALTVDDNENVYVTGISFGGWDAQEDFLTIKYSSEGEVIWINRYNGPGNSWDYPSAIVVDSSGNVYVAGTSANEMYLEDITVIRYSPDGDQEWINRFSGDGILWSHAVDAAIGVSGSIYIAGTAITNEYSDEIIAIKYDPDGAELWSVRYSVGSTGWSQSRAMAIDGAENIYITGESTWAPLYNTDFVTLKYNSEGDEIWVVHYDGPVQGWDIAISIALDPAGNVLVTGLSEGTDYTVEIATVKYDPDGTGVWDSRFKDNGSYWVSPIAVLVNESDEIFVVGEIPSAIFAVIRYDDEGNESWVKRYTGAGRSEDYARSVTVDVNGNVYVAGRSRTPATGDDYLTLKYNGSGELLWVVRYDGPASDDDIPTAIAVDNAGNVYVTGASMGAPDRFDYTTIKYNTDGEELWTSRYIGSGYYYNIPLDIKVDDIGNVYITGGSMGTTGWFNIVTIKYNPDGDELWVQSYNGPANDFDVGNALAVDVSGSVYVTGASVGGGGWLDYVTIKYSDSGEELWVRRYNGSGTGYHESVALVIDHTGNVIVTGSSWGTTSWSDYATVKYNPDGDQLWVRRYNGPANNDDYAVALAVDNTGSLYVTGVSMNEAYYEDYLTVKYNSDGEQQWTERFRIHQHSYNQPVGIVADNAGAVYVTGTTFSPYEQQYSITTVQYSQDGDQMKVLQYVSQSYLKAVDIAYDNLGGSLLIAGNISSGTSARMLTIKYNVPVSVNDHVIDLPLSFALYQNYPNPFNPVTTIRYDVPVLSKVSVQVYSILGERIATLVDEEQQPGYYSVVWNGLTDSGRRVASGVYIYIIAAENFRQSNKMVLLK